MLTITEDARTRLTELLSRSDDDTVVRIIRRKQHLKACLGNARPGDTTVAFDGRVLVAYGTRLSAALKSRLLHVRQTEKGPRLRLQMQAR